MSHQFHTPADLAQLRVPPSHPEAEAGVLGALLLNNSTWEGVHPLLKADDFYRHEHKLIYGAIGTLLEQGHPADVITVDEQLHRLGKREECGGLAYLNQLAQYVAAPINIRRYAELVLERAKLRRVLAAADEIAALGFNPGELTADQVVEAAEQKVLAIGDTTRRSGADFRTLADVMAERLEVLQARLAAGPGVSGLSTGFKELDEMTSGLQGGDLIILAARPSMGKTALALNIAEHVGLRVGKPVGVFSMEMSAGQLGDRLIAAVAGVNQKYLREPDRLQEHEWTRVREAADTLWHAPVVIDDQSAKTVAEVRSAARRLKHRHGDLALIVVDYLQLMGISPGMSEENRATAIGEISRGLKGLARELDCPVIALSQLSRSVESRTDKRPVMSDLRESGAIEQDADIVMFIYRDDYYYREASKEPGIAEIIISKHRNGPTGMFKLAFQKEVARFMSVADF